MIRAEELHIGMFSQLLLCWNGVQAQLMNTHRAWISLRDEARALNEHVVVRTPLSRETYRAVFLLPPPKPPPIIDQELINGADILTFKSKNRSNVCRDHILGRIAVGNFRANAVQEIFVDRSEATVGCERYRAPTVGSHREQQFILQKASVAASGLTYSATDRTIIEECTN